MPFTAAISAGIGAAGSIAGSAIQASAASKAAQQQAQLGQSALAQQNALFQQGFGLVKPFADYGLQLGQTAGNTLQGLLTPGPNQTAILSQLPGFQFAQDWGNKAVMNNASTLGFGGNTLTAASNFATGQAQQSFGQLAGLLQNLTQTGLSTGAGAAASAFGNATQTGANMANTYTGIGNALASGTLGSANAIAGGLSGAAGSASNALLLSKLFGGNALNPAANSNIPGIYSGTEGAAA